MTQPLVLLPGMMCDARLFGPQIAAFEPERQVIVPSIGGADSITQIASDILDNTPVRFALAGLSLGGILAMEVVRLAPDRVTHLALMDTNPEAEPAHIAARREPQIAKVRAGLLAEVMREEMKPNYLADGPGRAAVLDLVLEMALGQGEDVFIRQSRALQTRADQKELLRSVLVPTLVLCGAQDKLCPVARHILMAELVPGAELVIVPGAGHLPILEQPEAVTQAMAAWLGR